MTRPTKEDVVMAHRYIYYVLGGEAIPDALYDRIEKQARALCPPGSPVHGVGSSLPASYAPRHIEMAHKLLGETK